MSVPPLPDLDTLSLDELKKLVVHLLVRVSAQDEEIQQLRAENGRLKALPKKPKLAPGGRGCPGRCCKWMGVAQVDNYAASPRLARLEWSARVVARAAFRASRASLSFGNCL